MRREEKQKVSDQNRDAALERILLKIATGDTEALASLLEDATVAQLIEKVSTWAARKYQHEQADIRQALALRILTRINTLRNPRKLRAWLVKGATNYCEQEESHRKVESLRVQTSQPLSPEQQLIEKETQEDLLERLRVVTRLFPSWLVDRWARGESPKEIAKGTGISIKAIYAQLAALRRAIERQLAERDQSDLEDLLDGAALFFREPRYSNTLQRGRADMSGYMRTYTRTYKTRTTTRGRPASMFPMDEIMATVSNLNTAQLEKLVPQVIALSAERRAPHLKSMESRLLARANDALPHDLKSRLSKLQKKRDARSLSKAESEELITLSDRVEQLHAERLEALADLARLRGKTLTELMDQLQIRFPANA